MVAFEDDFMRTGVVGGSKGKVGAGELTSASLGRWIAAAGELTITSPGQVEATYVGQALYENRTSGTGGLGWERGGAEYPNDAESGRVALSSDGKGYIYEIDHNSTRFKTEPDNGTEYLTGPSQENNGIWVSANSDGVTLVDVEWELGGVRYGRRRTTLAGGGPSHAYAVKMLGSDLPNAPTQERFIVLVSTINGTDIDRFHFPRTPMRFFTDGDWYGGNGAAAVVLRGLAAAPSKLWEAEITGFVRSLDASTGDIYVVLAGNTEDGSYPATKYGIEFHVDSGGFASIGFYTEDGSFVNQGSVNTNSVEDNSITWDGPFPYDMPYQRYTFKMTANPTTGVCALWINGVHRGGCTIPQAEMTRMRDAYARRQNRIVGFGVYPLSFEKMEGSWVITNFKTNLVPPGSIEPGGSRSAFIHPVF